MAERRRARGATDTPPDDGLSGPKEEGPSFEDALQQLESIIRDGLVECDSNGSIRVTPLGRLLVRNVAMVFDAYLADQKKASKPMFSQTV